VVVRVTAYSEYAMNHVLLSVREIADGEIALQLIPCCRYY
jgi:hypothetical protein